MNASDRRRFATASAVVSSRIEHYDGTGIGFRLGASVGLAGGRAIEKPEEIVRRADEPMRRAEVAGAGHIEATQDAATPLDADAAHASAPIGGHPCS